MDIKELRITKLKEYLVEIINEINKNANINVNALSKDIESYSLDKIPSQLIIEKWITGEELHKDVYSFRSRKAYSYNEINNLNNIGFFEKFEKIISDNNKEKKIPQIEGIESIECLNCGTMNTANTGTAEFDIQIQINYRN